MKIFVMVPPASGHVNPICGIVNALCKDKTLNVIFYSDEQFRPAVEKTGAQFRCYSHLTFSQLPEKFLKTKTNHFCILLDEMITFSYNLLPQLIRDVEAEKPDLVIYDCFFVTGKYLIKILKHRFETNQRTLEPPKSLMFFPNFAMNEKIAQQFSENAPVDMWFPYMLFKVFLRQAYFSWYHGLRTFNPLGTFTEKHPILNLVAVLPEIQPFRDEFDSTYLFIGQCISEEARNFDVGDKELATFLEPFSQQWSESSPKLIYMSLGTIFNSNFFFFERAIEALNELEASARTRMIISVGEKNLAEFSNRISVPENVLVRAWVPQLEVLKRTSVFITHCGMNSTSESIKYGVPMVAIPIEGDQPVVARRVCDELGLGVRLKTENLTSLQIAEAIQRVLSEPSFRGNVEKMAKLMEKSDGANDGAKIILDYLHKKD